jgi:hypothetical protein
MKSRHYYWTLMLAALVAFSSCSKKQKDVKTLENDYLQQPQMTLGSSDSNEVRNEVNYYLEALNSKQVDKAVSMLYNYDLKTNKVSPLNDEERKRQKAVLNRFAGYKAKIEYIKFFRENDSQVKYNVYFSDKPSTPSNPNCMGFMIRPVRLNGKWYLTLAGENQSTYSSQIDKVH